MALTDPLRAEHAELRPHLDALDTLAADLSRPAPDLPARLADAVAFLQGHLVPHARAEEAALYPAVERALAAPGATATMRADHGEITRRIDRLAASLPSGVQLDDEQRESLRAQLYGLSAILHLHFAKEEDVLLPVLDAHLDAREASELFASMGHSAHPDEEAPHGEHDPG
jgi:iron-sulfur cluster repair protein YtfE (RIC family)